jgi:hypothetical protein
MYASKGFKGESFLSVDWFLQKFARIICYLRIIPIFSSLILIGKFVYFGLQLIGFIEDIHCQYTYKYPFLLNILYYQSIKNFLLNFGIVTVCATYLEHNLGTLNFFSLSLVNCFITSIFENLLPNFFNECNNCIAPINFTYMVIMISMELKYFKE